MKLIIAGGRDYRLTAEDREFLDSLDDVTEVVSGGATGADHDGEMWARERGIPVRRFVPAWRQYGRRAGPIRNAEMADHVGPKPDGAVVLFPGGGGTASMAEEADKVGLLVFDRRSTLSPPRDLTPPLWKDGL